MKPSIINILSIILIIASAGGCVHLDGAQPQENEATSTIKTTAEEVETNMESPGVTSEEAGDDMDVQIKF